MSTQEEEEFATYEIHWVLMDLAVLKDKFNNYLFDNDLTKTDACIKLKITKTQIDNMIKIKNYNPEPATWKKLYLIYK